MTPHPPQVLLTIAGHDPSSGAGITADLQVFSAHGFFGTSAITALTVQSTLGVAEVQPVEPQFLSRTLSHLCTDLPPAGIKIGMLGSDATAQTVADFLHSLPARVPGQPAQPQQEGTELGSSPATHKAPNQPLPVILDPILHASSGASLLDPAALETLHEHLLPVVNWVTPNWQELAALTNLTVETLGEAENAAHTLAARHPHLHIVATGGDQFQPTDLLLLPFGEIHRFAGKHIDTTSTHGTGCAFSSAILCRLVLGDTPVAAVHAVKRYVTEALSHAPNIGHGRGPMDLLWTLSYS